MAQKVNPTNTSHLLKKPPRECSHVGNIHQRANLLMMTKIATLIGNGDLTSKKTGISALLCKLLCT